MERAACHRVDVARSTARLTASVVDAVASCRPVSLPRSRCPPWLGVTRAVGACPGYRGGASTGHHGRTCGCVLCTHETCVTTLWVHGCLCTHNVRDHLVGARVHRQPRVHLRRPGRLSRDHPPLALVPVTTPARARRRRAPPQTRPRVCGLTTQTHPRMCGLTTRRPLVPGGDGPRRRQVCPAVWTSHHGHAGTRSPVGDWSAIWVGCRAGHHTHNRSRVRKCRGER